MDSAEDVEEAAVAELLSPGRGDGGRVQAPAIAIPAQASRASPLFRDMEVAGSDPWSVTALGQEVEGEEHDHDPVHGDGDAGLMPEELVGLLAPLVNHPLAIGLSTTTYDPAFDPDRSCARLLLGILERLSLTPHALFALQDSF